MKRVACVAVLVLVAAGCASSGGGPLTAQGLFDRHIEASGLERHQTVTLTGKMFIDAFGVQAPLVLKTKAPDKYSMVAQIPGMEVKNGCNGDSCWDQQPGSGAQDLNGDRLQFAMQQADFFQFAHMDRYYDSLEIQPEPEGGSDTHKVQATRASGDVDTYEFSKDTGFLKSVAILTPTPQGPMVVTTTNNVYTEYDGTQVVTELLQATPMFSLRIVIDDVSFDDIADSEFTK